MGKRASLRQQEAVSRFLQTLVQGAGQVYGGIQQERQERQFSNLLSDITGGKVTDTREVPVESPYGAAPELLSEDVRMPKELTTRTETFERERTPDEQAKALVSLMLRSPQFTSGQKLQAVMADITGKRRTAAELAKEKRAETREVAKEKRAETRETELQKLKGEQRLKQIQATYGGKEGIRKLADETRVRIAKINAAAKKSLETHKNKLKVTGAKIGPSDIDKLQKQIKALKQQKRFLDDPETDAVVAKWWQIFTESTTPEEIAKWNAQHEAVDALIEEYQETINAYQKKVRAGLQDKGESVEIETTKKTKKPRQLKLEDF